jgi:hypothetical protein
MLACSPEPGGDQQGAELVAVQGDGMRLVVHPRPAHVRSRRAPEKFFLDRVFVEPGDGGQPPGDRGTGPAPGFQVPGEALAVRTADGEQGQGPGTAPGGELAQVECIGFPGQATVPGQEAGEGDPLGIGEDRLDRGELSGWGRQWSSGTSRPGWNREAGPVPAPAIQRKPNVNRLATSRYVGNERAARPNGPREKYSIPPTLRQR